MNQHVLLDHCNSHGIDNISSSCFQLDTKLLQSTVSYSHRSTNSISGNLVVSDDDSCSTGVGNLSFGHISDTSCHSRSIPYRQLVVKDCNISTDKNSFDTPDIEKTSAELCTTEDKTYHDLEYFSNAENQIKSIESVEACNLIVSKKELELKEKMKHLETDLALLNRAALFVIKVFSDMASDSSCIRNQSKSANIIPELDSVVSVAEALELIGERVKRFLDLETRIEEAQERIKYSRTENVELLIKLQYLEYEIAELTRYDTMEAVMAKLGEICKHLDIKATLASPSSCTTAGRTANENEPFQETKCEVKRAMRNQATNNKRCQRRAATLGTKENITDKPETVRISEHEDDDCDGDRLETSAIMIRIGKGKKGALNLSKEDLVLGIDSTSDNNDTVNISIDDEAETQNSAPAYDFCIGEAVANTCNDAPFDDFCIDEVVVKTHSDAPADDFSHQSIVQEDVGCLNQVDKKSHVCEVCNKNFQRSSVLKYHMAIHTGDKPYKCSTCDRSFRTSAQRTIHVRIHSGERPFSCKMCGKTFVRQGDWKVHSRVHNKDDQYSCTCCTASFTRRKYLKRHQLIHTGERPHECEECNKKFVHPRSLAVHIKRQHRNGSLDELIHENKFKCGVCEKLIAGVYGLKKHMAIHNGIKPYTCHMCGESFVQKSNLKYHIKSHYNEKKYKCVHCGRAFIRQGDLNYHMKRHMVDKNGKQSEGFMCDFCGKVLADRKNLANHVLLHSGGSKYNCEHCDKCFHCTDALKEHTRRQHLSSKTYQCDLCGNVLASPHSLTSHRMIHTGEKPYKCDQCEATFRKSGTLKAHSVLHTGEMPFICIQCGTRFKHRNQLHVHIKNRHV